MKAQNAQFWKQSRKTDFPWSASKKIDSSKVSKFEYEFGVYYVSIHKVQWCGHFKPKLKSSLSRSKAEIQILFNPIQ